MLCVCPFRLVVVPNTSPVSCRPRRATRPGTCTPASRPAQSSRPTTLSKPIPVRTISCSLVRVPMFSATSFCWPHLRLTPRTILYPTATRSLPPSLPPPRALDSRYVQSLPKGFPTTLLPEPSLPTASALPPNPLLRNTLSLPPPTQPLSSLRQPLLCLETTILP